MKPEALPLPETSLACVESLSLPPIQEIVLLEDFQCAKGQKRVADIISRMDQVDSMEVNVSGKKVTLVSRTPGVVPGQAREVAALGQSHPGTATMLARKFCRRISQLIRQLDWAQCPHRPPKSPGKSYHVSKLTVSPVGT